MFPASFRSICVQTSVDMWVVDSFDATSANLCKFFQNIYKIDTFVCITSLITLENCILLIPDLTYGCCASDFFDQRRLLFFG